MEVILAIVLVVLAILFLIKVSKYKKAVASWIEKYNETYKEMGEAQEAAKQKELQMLSLKAELEPLRKYVPIEDVEKEVIGLE